MALLHFQQPVKNITREVQVQTEHIKFVQVWNYTHFMSNASSLTIWVSLCYDLETGNQMVSLIRRMIQIDVTHQIVSQNQLIME